MSECQTLRWILVSRIGFEPMTPSLKGKRSTNKTPSHSYFITDRKNPVQELSLITHL